MAGKFFRVDTKGSYLEPKSELKCGPPTVLTLSDIGLSPGDFIALQCTGTFSAGVNYPNQTGLGACFFAGSKPVSPGSFGQQEPIFTPPTWPNQLSTDIEQDFFVPQNREIIVRVPERASRLAFSVPDSYFDDNSDQSGKFGVLVSKPNSKLTLLANMAELESMYTQEQDIVPWEWLSYLERLIPVLSEWPTATGFSTSPTHTVPGSHGASQYRGWYLKSGWNPNNSKFNPAGSGSRKHYGIDIFAPRGTTLIVPVGPCWVDLIPDVKGYGNTVAFRFLFGKEKYTCIYAHCDKFLFKTGRLASHGEVVASAGCSGNSAEENCGIQLSSGGRTDHVHVGMYKGAVISDAASPTDPLAVLGWKPRTPS